MRMRLQGWKVGRWIALGMLLSNIPTFPLSAQVGHDPASSTFHDIPLLAGPVFFAGKLTNDRGRAGAGVSNALAIGARYEIPAGRSLLLLFSASYLMGDRFIIDPTADSTSPQRRTGPYDANLLLTDFGIQLRLTGGKSWRGIAPYVGGGIGLVFDASSPGDTTGSQYKFGTKLTLHGATGVRWYPSRRLSVVADVRGQMWRLRYPTSFKTPAADGSRVIPVLDPATDWTLHPWISLGVGWTF